MMPLRLVWLDATKGLLTQPLRSMISVMAIAMTMLALMLLFNLNFAAKQQMEQALHAVGPHTFHAWVFPSSGNDHAIHPSQVSRLKGDALNEKTGIRIYPYAYLVEQGTEQEQVFVVACESQMLQLLGYKVQQGIGFFEHANLNSIHIGNQVALDYKVSAFDSFWISNQGYQILSIFEPINPNPLLNFIPDKTVFVSLEDFKHRGDHLEDFLITYHDSLSKKEAKAVFEAKINHYFGDFNIQYRDDEFITHSIKQSLASVQKLLQTFAWIAIGLGVVGIFSQQWMSFWQRRGECGMRISLGATKAELGWLFMVESLFLGVFGAVLGSLFGIMALQGLYQHLGWPWVVSLSVSSVLGLGCVLLAAISATIPAIIAANSRPTQLLAHQ